MTVYKALEKFKKKYPITIGWRLKQHAKIIDKHMNPGEKVMYAFTAQKNDSPFNIVTSCAVVMTNKRLLVGQKRVIFGYYFTSITPDLFNDLKVDMGLVWGKVLVDTVKELLVLSNISREALPEIETSVSEFMMHEKKKYGKRSKK